MDRKQKKFFKQLTKRTQKEIWTAEFNMAIIDGLVIEYSRERLKLLEEKLANFIAKDLGEDKKKTYDTTHRLEDEITMEKNVIKGAKIRKKKHIVEIRERRGKIEFLKKYIKGK